MVQKSPAPNTPPKTVFISYRRTSVYTAHAVYKNLREADFDVFFDYESLDSGAFEQVILNQIAARAHFVLILTPGALERCDDPNDWLRREIEYAIDLKRNIIPLMFNGFSFITAKPYLVGKLAALAQYNGLEIPQSIIYFDTAMQHLRERFLSKTLEGVIHPTPQADQSTIRRRLEAVEALPKPTNTQLAAEEHLHRGDQYERQRDYAGAIEQYTLALAIDFRFVPAYTSRAQVYHELGELDNAIADLSDALKYDPKGSFAYHNYIDRAEVYEKKREFRKASHDYAEAIRLKPEYTLAYLRRGRMRLKTKTFKGAIDDFSQVVRLQPNYAMAYYYRGLAYKNSEERGLIVLAIKDFETYLELGGAKQAGENIRIEMAIKALKKQIRQSES